MQVSVDDQNFDPKNFFTLEDMGFKKDRVKFNKGWLGIFMENAEDKGILVKDITMGSPAAKAGLKAGDIITKINNESTLGKDDLNLIQFKKTVEAAGAGGVPEIAVFRDNTEMVFKPELFRKLLNDIPESVTPFISKVECGHTKENKNTQPLSPPSQGGVNNSFPDKKTSASSKRAGASFIKFAIKNESYKDMLGATLQRIGEEAYAREGFQTNNETNPFRLSIINYLMLHPFETPGIGQAIFDTFGSKDVCAQLGYAAELLDVPLNLSSTGKENNSSLPPCEGGDRGVVHNLRDASSDTGQLQKTATAVSLQEQLQVVIDSLVPCVSLIQQAFCNLSPEETEFLYQNAHTVWLPDEKIESQDLVRLLTLSQRVNLARLFDAASLLLNKLYPMCLPLTDATGDCKQETDTLGKTLPDAIQMNVSPFRIPASLLCESRQEIPGKTSLCRKPAGNSARAKEKESGDPGPAAHPTPGKTRADDGRSELVPDFAGDILFVQDTSIGKIVVGGTGTSYYYADAAVIIDLGGNDFYFNNAGSSGKDRPISLCIDLSGDDVYNATNSFSHGTGRFGIGVLMDVKGNDRYLCKDFSQGTGLFGIGLLMDNNGNDFYSGHVINQGVGFFGAGFLNDMKGNDVYFSRQFAQGVGFTKGFGALIDTEGNDFYFAGGEYPDFRDPGKSFQSMSQGLGMGFRPEETIVGASGGIGMLIDQKGADQYHGDYFSQGSGYYFSLGFLYDNEGNDRYYAGRYAQGAGIHSAIGLLKDTSGDDTYECTFGVSQGCGHDTGIGFLVDECGNDVYRSGTTSQGVGLEKGIGVLADLYGNDTYHANDLSQGISIPSKTEEVNGMGMLLDNQGDHNIFHDSIAKNLLFYRSNGGLVLNK